MPEQELKIKIVADIDRPSWQAAAQQAANAFKGSTATPTGTSGLTAAANTFNRRDMQARRDAIHDQEMLRAAQKKANKDQVTFLKDMSFLMMPVFNPGSVWATLFSTRQTFSAMNTDRGQSLLKKFGLSGTSGAAIGTAGLVGGATALGIAFAALKKVVEGSKQAIDKAFGIYTGAAQAGLSTGFFTQRQTAANVLGVTGNPNQVFMFGKAVQYVSQRTADANKVLAETARPLAEVEMRFRILKVDLSALFAKIANDAAPAVNQLTDALDGMVKWAFKVKYIAALLTPPPIQAMSFFKQAMGTNNPKSNIPALLPTMRQLPASSWEHMGLVIGSGGGNPAQVTARNTTKMVNTLQRIYMAIGGSGGNLGLNPNVSHQ